MTQIQTKFDYNMLATDDRQFIVDRENQIETIMKRASWDIGRLLLDVKYRLPHGQFGSWLKHRFQWSERTARNLMNIAKKFKTARDADLFPKQSQILLSSPSVSDEVRQEAIDLASSGYDVNPETIGLIKLAQKVKFKATHMVENIFKIKNDIIEVKHKLDAEQWHNWLMDEFGFDADITSKIVSIEKDEPAKALSICLEIFTPRLIGGTPCTA